jgi:hypothetical protein
MMLQDIFKQAIQSLKRNPYPLNLGAIKGATTIQAKGNSDPNFQLIQKYFPKDQWENAYNVMMAESSGKPDAVGDTNTPIPSYGLFQIRGFSDRPNPSILLTPEENVKYAAQMYKRQGWQPWSAARKLNLY